MTPSGQIMNYFYSLILLSIAQHLNKEKRKMNINQRTEVYKIEEAELQVQFFLKRIKQNLQNR